MLPEISTSLLPPVPPVHLQYTYINDKHLEFAFLYKYGASEAG